MNSLSPGQCEDRHRTFATLFYADIHSAAVAGSSVKALSILFFRDDWFPAPLRWTNGGIPIYGSPIPRPKQMGYYWLTLTLESTSTSLFTLALPFSPSNYREPHGISLIQGPIHDRHYREWNSEHRIFHQIFHQALRSSSRSRPPRLPVSTQFPPLAVSSYIWLALMLFFKVIMQMSLIAHDSHLFPISQEKESTWLGPGIRKDER